MDRRGAEIDQPADPLVGTVPAGQDVEDPGAAAGVDEHRHRLVAVDDLLERRGRADVVDLAGVALDLQHLSAAPAGGGETVGPGALGVGAYDPPPVSLQGGPAGPQELGRRDETVVAR